MDWTLADKTHDCETWVVILCIEKPLKILDKILRERRGYFQSFLFPLRKCSERRVWYCDSKSKLGGN
jgi:hypothetical protein